MARVPSNDPYVRADDPKELIELCENCPHSDCYSRDGCDEYKKLAKALKNGTKAKAPAIELEELPGPVQNTQLHKYNEAIRALEELQPYAINMDTEITGMLGALKCDRSVKFDYLVDWEAIARGGRK